MPEPTLTIVHETTYRYDRPVERSRHLFRLRPVDDLRQHVVDFSLCMSVGGVEYEFEDVFGNRAAAAAVDVPFTELSIVTRSRVRVVTDALPDGPRPRLSSAGLFLPRERQVLLPYLLPPELPDDQLREMADYASEFAERNDFDVLDTLLDVNATIHRDFAYARGTTTGATTAYEVFCTRRGVCQDFTTLFLCLARLLGIPARYRMGYFHGGGDGGAGAERATHAWAEAYLANLGWRGFDPTHGCLAQAGHVRVACGRTAGDATPTSGAISPGGCREVLNVAVRVDEGEP